MLPAGQKPSFKLNIGTSLTHFLQILSLHEFFLHTSVQNTSAVFGLVSESVNHRSSCLLQATPNPELTTSQGSRHNPPPLPGFIFALRSNVSLCFTQVNALTWLKLVSAGWPSVDIQFGPQCELADDCDG